MQLAHFAILFKCRCLLISSKAQQASCFPTLKNLKTNYQNTSIQLSQSCLVGSKWKSKNCKKSRFFWFLNLHNLLERACDHIKRCIFWKCTWTCLEICCKIPWNLFWCIKNWLKWKILVFKKLPSQKSVCDFLKISKTYTTWIFMPCLHKKLWVVGKWNCPW